VAIFLPNCVVNRLSRMTTLHSFRLVGQKNGHDSDNSISVNRPWWIKDILPQSLAFPLLQPCM